MNQGKARGDYATAYKLSGAAVDKKAHRRLRRSIEQKEFRQEKINNRRNLVDLSPLQESDVSCNKHYQDKTPVKAKDKPNKALDRLEQLKKWKEERERKRKEEDNKYKPAFRVSKALDRKSETRLFEASKLKKHPVKPQPVPVSKPVVSKAAVSSKPATQRSTRSQLAPPPKIRQTSATRQSKQTVSNKQDNAKKVKDHITKPVSTRTLRSATRQTTVEYNTKTRQSTNTVATQPKPKALRKPFEAEPVLVMSPAANPSFITHRVDSNELPDSFAPADFTFDMSSFVFRPLSPSSAAGFLSANQNTSCSSFVESNPKRSSTPKGKKKSRKQEPVIKMDTTVVEENEDKNETKTDNTTQIDNNETVVSSPEPEKKNQRRSSRRKSTLSTTSIENSAVDAPTSVDKPTTTSKATPRRRSLRVSLLSATTDTDDIDSKSTAVESPNVRRSSRRRSVTTSSSDSDSKAGSDKEVSGPAKRRSTRRSVTSENLVADEKDLVKAGTPTRELRRSRRSVAPEPIPEVEESSQDSDEVFEEEKNTHNVSGIDNNKENDKPVDSVTDAKLKFDARIGHESSSGQRKTPKRARNKSFGGFRLPSADSVVLSGKRSRRKTLMPKSPEEWVEVLNNSPMVEMSRRKKSKLGNTSLPALNFDDIDFDDMNVEKENTVLKPAVNEPVLNLGDKLNEEISSEVETTKSISPAKDQHTVDNDAIVESTMDVDNKENVDTNKIDLATAEHDVPYFRELLRSETSRLTKMCDHWTEVNENTQLNDDVHGQIRACVGKAQLLIAQRFKQFTGLVDNCEFKTGEKETTCTDLDGFWEMVYFQVEDCDNKFAELKKLQDNNWIDNTVKPVVKKVKKKVKAAVTKPVVKSKFAAFRAQMKKQKTESVNSPGVVKKVEEKVFEIPGFFTVSSPVRSPKPHCAAGTPNKATPSSSTKEDDSAKKSVDTLSVPLSSTELVVCTPPRRSYIPAVPSPLLQDTTPLPRPSRSCTKKTPIPKRLIDEVEGSETSALENENKRTRRSSVRRSLRSRQSVNFADTVPDSPKPDVSDEEFSRLLQPSTGVETNEDYCDVSNESFSKYLEPSCVLDASVDKVDTPERSMRRRSCLKGCKSTERRRSRQRSVHFGSPKPAAVSHFALPHTPFNKNSLVEQKRVTRSTPSNSYDVFDFDNEDNDENVPPPSHRSPRLSLLGTPPDVRRKVVPTVEVPTANLISFTP